MKLHQDSLDDKQPVRKKKKDPARITYGTTGYSCNKIHAACVIGIGITRRLPLNMMAAKC